jgi:predicted small integral membrane protein
MVHITTSWRGAAVVVAIALVVLGVVAWSLTRSGSTPADLGTRTAQAGEVEVTMTALTLDRSGAVFKIMFDTHTVELGLDPATAVMTVNGTQAAGAAWDGSGPGGHHREGTLRFTTPVPLGAAVELRITGLPQDAIGTWTAP